MNIQKGSEESVFLIILIKDSVNDNLSFCYVTLKLALKVRKFERDSREIREIYQRLMPLHP